MVLAYGSLSAACRATECLKAKRRTDFDGRTMSLSPWSFEMLESAGLFAQAAGNARHARVLAIAVSEANHALSEATEHWLVTCLSRRHQAQLTVAAILRKGDLGRGAAKPWVESVRRIVAAPDVPSRHGR